MASARAISLDRMIQAVENVRVRLMKAVAALEAAGVPYAVAGGHAVAAWVSTVDTGAVRNTRDVDILIRRSDLEAAKEALAKGGFVYRHVAGVDLFLDHEGASAREAVHLVFAGEKVRENEPLPNPTLDEAEESDNFRVISLRALVQIKLTAYRDKDRTHLRDLIDVGLVDESWVELLPEEIRPRLRALLDNPEG